MSPNRDSSKPDIAALQTMISHWNDLSTSCDMADLAPSAIAMARAMFVSGALSALNVMRHRSFVSDDELGELMRQIDLVDSGG